MESKIGYALELLSGEPLEELKSMNESVLSRVDEIRLRAKRRVSLSVGKEDILLKANAGTEDIEHCFKTAFSYSMHSYSKELSQGYITTRGGNRVGICGTAVFGADKDSVESVKYISSLNIRIAREVNGCADGIFSECFSDGLCGLLIVGPPASGKTTVLRELSRLLGNTYKISLIDELNEISASYRGFSQNDVGILTDVFVGYPKHVGISTAVRVMSPRGMIVDEIGSEQDGKALEYALYSGIKLITAVHGTSLESVSKKPAIKRLLESGAFSYAAVLNSSRELKVQKIV